MGRLKPRVLKFGGTSVGSAEPLRSAVGIVGRQLREAPIVVVVSALAGVTDSLEAALAGAAAGRLDVARFADSLRARHLALLRSVASGRAASRAAGAVGDRLSELMLLLGDARRRRASTPAAHASTLATGERLAAPIVAAALRSIGIDARALDAARVVRTDEAWDAASVDFSATRRLAADAFAALPPTTVPVLTGFIGGTSGGHTTLLGRGGSDYTAAVLGWALEAERVEIWTDVPGVMSADPRRDVSARTLPRLGYREAAELARSGAKVLHPRTLEPLEPVGIPVFVGRTLEPGGPGTWIGRPEGGATRLGADGTAA